MTFQDVIALSEKDDNITWEDLEPYECEKVTAAYNTTITRNRYPLEDPDWFLEVEEQVSDSSISKVQLYVYRGGAMDREGWLSMNCTGILEQAEGFWRMNTFGTGAALSLKNRVES